MATDTEVENLLALHGLRRERVAASGVRPRWRVFRRDTLLTTLRFGAPIERYIQWLHDRAMPDDATAAWWRTRE